VAPNPPPLKVHGFERARLALRSFTPCSVFPSNPPGALFFSADGTGRCFFLPFPTIFRTFMQPPPHQQAFFPLTLRDRSFLTGSDEPAHLCTLFSDYRNCAYFRLGPPWPVLAFVRSGYLLLFSVAELVHASALHRCKLLYVTRIGRPILRSHSLSSFNSLRSSSAKGPFSCFSPLNPSDPYSFDKSGALPPDLGT